MYISSNTMRASRRYAVAACLSVFWIGAANAQGTRAPESFADLAQAKLPSVVTITATDNGDQQSGTNQGRDNGSRDRGIAVSEYRDFHSSSFHRVCPSRTS